MGKVHPQAAAVSSSSSFFTAEQESFTVWMKSLVLNGKGCTVFDSNGRVLYRVDNYNCKCCNEVHLMDFTGKVLFTILRKKYMKLFGCWEGYRAVDAEKEKKKPEFRVRKIFKILRRRKEGVVYEVMMGLDKKQPYGYNIESSNNKKSTCKILDKLGMVVAEVKRKQSTCGVVLGEDVLTMVVEPSIDHSLIMGLFVVHCLINSKM